jgi:hypothetical protein
VTGEEDNQFPGRKLVPSHQSKELEHIFEYKSLPQRKYIFRSLSACLDQLQFERLIMLAEQKHCRVRSMSKILQTISGQQLSIRRVIAGMLDLLSSHGRKANSAGRWSTYMRHSDKMYIVYVLSLLGVH